MFTSANKELEPVAPSCAGTYGAFVRKDGSDEICKCGTTEYNSSNGWCNNGAVEFVKWGTRPSGTSSSGGAQAGVKSATQNAAGDALGDFMKNAKTMTVTFGK